MSNDLQATISTQLGRTLGDLAKVQTSLKQLHSEVKNVNRETNAFQQHGSRSFREAGAEAESLSSKMKEAGHGVHFFGGAVGKAGLEMSRLAGFAAATGPIGAAVAVAMMAAGIAVERYNKNIEQNVEMLKKQAEAEDQHREAIIKAKEEMEKTAAGGGTDEGNRDKLDAMTGGKGVERARKIATAEHLDEKDVRKGLIEISRLPQKLQETMIASVTRAARSGAGSFSELAAMGARNPMFAASGNADTGAAFLSEKAVGLRLRGDTARLYENIRRNAGPDSMHSRQGRLNDIGNEKLRFQEDQFQHTDLPERAAKRDLDATKDPLTLAMIESHRIGQKQVDLLQKIADASNPIAKRVGVYTDAQRAADVARAALAASDNMNPDNITPPGFSPSDSQ